MLFDSSLVRDFAQHVVNVVFFIPTLWNYLGHRQCRLIYPDGSTVACLIYQLSYAVAFLRIFPHLWSQKKKYFESRAKNEKERGSFRVLKLIIFSFVHASLQEGMYDKFN